MSLGFTLPDSRNPYRFGPPDLSAHAIAIFLTGDAYECKMRADTPAPSSDEKRNAP